MIWQFRENPDFFGGTEYMVSGFRKNIAPSLNHIKTLNQIVVPGVFPDGLTLFGAPCILWLHNTPRQYNPETIALLKHENFQSLVVSLVVPSFFAKKQWVEFGFKEETVTVIPNAIDPLPVKSSMINKNLKMLYTSHSSRGLEMLLRATNHISEDFQLDIFSTLRTNGVDFRGERNTVKWISELENLDKITFYGSSEKRTITRHLLESDLFVYPAVFLETFCLAAVEAMAVGLPIVTTKHGALQEMLGSYPSYFKYHDKYESMIERDAGTNLDHYKTSYPKYFETDVKALASAIDEKIRYIKNNPVVDTELAKSTQEKFSWAECKRQWLELDEKIGTLL